VAIESPYLRDGDRYERTMHGWVDAPDERHFRITVRLADPVAGIELTALTTPSPEYAIREARGRVLVADLLPGVDPGLGVAMAALAGVTMTAGFTRRVAEAAGGRAGAAYFVDAAIEIARLARQVTRMPSAVIARHLAEGPVGHWRLDMQGWVDLPVSCYTYRPESEPLFAERTVTTPMPADLYAPPAGAAGVFNRTKTARLERRDGGLALSHAMFDEVHSFQVWYRADAEGRIVEAESLTPRLPYRGICSDPQARVRELVGEHLDAGLRKRLGGLVGGTTGCAQLYDLTADLLKLLTLS
jgi:hypothetical protein